MLNDRLNRNAITGSTRLFIVTALLATTVAIAAAQNLFSTFSGSVRDSQGAVLPGVTLVLSNAQKQTKYEVKSDRNGSFEFPGLQTGGYELEASTPGFATLHQSVDVSGQNLDRDLVLHVGSLEETITVTDTEKYDGTVARQSRSPRPLAPCTPSSVGGNIRPPFRVKNTNPQYPQAFHGTGTESVVALDGYIGLDGFIKDFEIRNRPLPAFADAAIAAVTEWQWDQTLLNCVPVEVPITITVKFKPAP
jgi:hypothetical protein